jgi:hypothetical protein
MDPAFSPQYPKHWGTPGRAFGPAYASRDPVPSDPKPHGPPLFSAFTELGDDYANLGPLPNTPEYIAARQAEFCQNKEYDGTTTDDQGKQWHHFKDRRHAKNVFGRVLADSEVGVAPQRDVSNATIPQRQPRATGTHSDDGFAAYTEVDEETDRYARRVAENNFNGERPGGRPKIKLDSWNPLSVGRGDDAMVVYDSIPPPAVDSHILYIAPAVEDDNISDQRPSQGRYLCHAAEPFAKTGATAYDLDGVPAHNKEQHGAGTNRFVRTHAFHDRPDDTYKVDWTEAGEVVVDGRANVGLSTFEAPQWDMQHSIDQSNVGTFSDAKPLLRVRFTHDQPVSDQLLDVNHLGAKSTIDGGSGEHRSNDTRQAPSQTDNDMRLRTTPAGDAARLSTAVRDSGPLQWNDGSTAADPMPINMHSARKVLLDNRQQGVTFSVAQEPARTGLPLMGSTAEQQSSVVFEDCAVEY